MSKKMEAMNTAELRVALANAKEKIAVLESGLVSAHLQIRTLVTQCNTYAKEVDTLQDFGYELSEDLSA